MHILVGNVLVLAYRCEDKFFLNTRKLEYEHFTLAFLLQNNLYEFTTQKHIGDFFYSKTGLKRPF